MPFEGTAPGFYPLSGKVSLVCLIVSATTVFSVSRSGQRAANGLFPLYLSSLFCYAASLIFSFSGEGRSIRYLPEILQGLFGALTLTPLIGFLMIRKVKAGIIYLVWGVIALFVFFPLSESFRGFLPAVYGISALGAILFLIASHVREPEENSGMEAFFCIGAVFAIGLGNLADSFLSGPLQETPLLTLIMPALSVAAVEKVRGLEKTGKEWDFIYPLLFFPVGVTFGILYFRHLDQLKTSGGDIVWAGNNQAQTALVISSAITAAYFLLKIPFSFLLSRVHRRIKEVREKNEAVTKKEVEKAYAELNLRLNEEKLKLAGDIHDTFAQETFAARLQINLIEKTLKNASPATKNDLTALKAMVDQAQRQSRILIEKLKKPESEVFHIRSLQEFIDTLRNRPGACLIEAKGLSILESLTDCKQKENISLMAEEALNNAVKHSNGTKIIIRIRTVRNRFIMLILDNGRGFDQKQVKNKTGFGMQSLVNRCERITGEIIIRSVNGKGTAVLIRCPLNNTAVNK